MNCWYVFPTPDDLVLLGFVACPIYTLTPELSTAPCLLHALNPTFPPPPHQLLSSEVRRATEQPTQTWPSALSHAGFCSTRPTTQLSNGGDNLKAGGPGNLV